MGELYRNKYRTTSARLKDWDYSTPWWYYVTICTKDMRCWLGKVKNESVVHNKIGMIVKKYFEDIPVHFNFAETDYHIVMPNHVHGIIIINPSVETGHAPSLRKPTLGNIVGNFKSAVTRWSHKNDHPYFAWQPRFYDHIIRNEHDLYRIRKYIENNPLKWELDKYYVNTL
jgi:REP-associated tyrosine transposase